MEALRKERAKAVEHFGETTQFMANEAEWLSTNGGDQLERSGEGVLEVREWLDAPEEAQHAGGRRVEAAEAMDCGAANAAANGC